MNDMIYWLMNLQKKATFLHRLATDKRKELFNWTTDAHKNALNEEIEILDEIANLLLRLDEAKKSIDFFFKP